MMTEQEQSLAALQQHLAEIRERAAVLKAQHAEAQSRMNSLLPKPGAQPTRRARFMFAKYAAETAAFLAVLDS
jgi:hypothetical protein